MKWSGRDWYEKVYLVSPHWIYIRDAKLGFSEYTCADCGYRRFPYKRMMPMRLNVHHLTYATLGNERLADLVVLCEKCHCRRHGIDYLSHCIGFWSVREILAGGAA